jgi:type I restriction enzyme S subunit
VSWLTVPASELILKRGGSINPSKYPNEVFELYSIPACDVNTPEIVEGADIGSSKSCIEPNDVLLSKIFPHIRRSWVVPNKKEHKQIGSGEWIVFRDDRFNPQFLKYFLTCDIFHHQFMKTVAGVGGSLVRARPVFVERIHIPLPPMDEQNRIVAVLDKADAIRKKRQHTIKLANDFLTSAFIEWFGDPRHSKFDVFELKNVTTKITDGAHFTPTYVESGIPFLRVTDINKSEIDWGNTKFIPKDEHETLINRCKPEKGDVLYSKNGTIGIPRLIDWDTEFSIFVSLCLIKTDQTKLRGKYLESFLKTPFALAQATSKAKSATVSNLHLVEIKEIKLPVPPLVIQDDWVRFIDKYSETLNNLKMSFKYLDDVFNSLNQKAFAGEL